MKNNDALDMAIASWKGIKYQIERMYLDVIDGAVRVPIHEEDIKTLGLILDAIDTRPQPCGDAVKVLDEIFFENHGNRVGWEEAAIKQYETIRAALTQPPKPNAEFTKAWDEGRLMMRNDLTGEMDIVPQPKPPFVIDDAGNITPVTQPKADVETIERDMKDKYAPEGTPSRDAIICGIEHTMNYLATQGYIDEWQDISTAPKPLGFEEVWILGSDGTDVRTTRWCTEYPRTGGVWFLNYEPTDYIPNINYWYPTKWKHLPKA